MLLLQEEIDIFEGIKDRQALQMAKNLGFQGPLQQQVIWVYCLALAEDFLAQLYVKCFPTGRKGQVSIKSESFWHSKY